MRAGVRPLSIVIAAGGTGGHLYPAVALAKEFRRLDPDTTVLFVGTARGIESKVLAHEGFDLQMINAQPFMGRGIGGALRALFWLPVGFWQSIKILRRRSADLVVGVGGYTSPALVVAAFASGIRRVILEPNADAGMANRALGPIANLVFLAFDSAREAFAPSKVRVVGTPVRREFIETVSTSQASAREGRSTLLIFGGSQGATALNQAMMEALPYLVDLRERVEVIHQTGEADCERVQASYRSAGFHAAVAPFLFDMPHYLKRATLVVARSGATTLAELTVCGKAAILVPLPHAIYDHQRRNARVLESAGSAVVIPQSQLTGARLAKVIADLLNDPERVRLMSERSRALGRLDSAEAIAQECLALVQGAPGAGLGLRG